MASYVWAFKILFNGINYEAKTITLVQVNQVIVGVGERQLFYYNHIDFVYHSCQSAIYIKYVWELTILKH